MGGRAGRLGWRRVLPVLCVLAIGLQLGPLGLAQEAPGRQADMTLDKSDRVDPVAVTNTISYDLNFRNLGPHTATGVRIVDHLPPEVAYDKAVASDHGSCEADGSVVTCDGFDSFIDGERGRVTIFVTAMTASDSVLNTAEVFTDSNDYNPSNNIGTERTHIDAVAVDLYATKTGPAEVTVEDTFRYWLRATNDGPSTAENVEITDQLPGGVEFVAASDGCSESGGTVTCSKSSVNKGAFFDAWIDVQAKVVGTVSNSASVSSDGSDTDEDNNESAPVTTEIKEIPVPEADVSITKSGPATATNGDQFTYGLKVTNGGPDPAADVTITDLLPSGVSFVSASTGCAESEGTVTCDLDTLPPGSRDLSITVAADSAGQITNTASVTTSTVDTNGDNNTSNSVSTDIAASADLSIVKDGPSNATVGDTFSYELTVSNAGPDAANGVEAVDTLPSGLEVADEGDCAASAGTVTCSLNGPLAGGASADFSFDVRATSDGDVTNSATVSSTTSDPDGSDNTSSAQTTIVEPTADLSITKSGPADAETGDSLTYTLNVTNAGPDVAEAVTVSDTLPSGLTYDSSADCTHLNGTVTCALGSISSGGSGDATFEATANQAGSVTNSASVTSSTDDPNPDNNSGSKTTTVTDPPPPPDANVTIAMTDSADPVTDGDTFNYKITIDNAGPDEAHNLKVVDTLPSGLDAGTLPSGCSSSGRVITCDGLGSLTASAVPLKITIPVVANGAGTRTNRAVVSWNASGSPTETASASQTTTVEPEEQVAPPPPPPQDNTTTEEEPIDACPTAARHSSANASEGLLAFVPAAIRLEQGRRRRLTMVDGSTSPKKRSRSKIFKIAGIVALLAVVAVAGVLFMTRGGDKGIAKLGGLEGRVDLAKQGKSYEPAAQAAGLDIGDKVRTGVDGLARIDYFDGSLTRLDHNTTFKVQELVDDATHKAIKTELDVGRVWHRVEKLTKPGDRFEVKTVTAVATVRGTTFVNDCRFDGGRECSHIGIEGAFGVLTLGGDNDTVTGGECKTEEGQDLGPCRFTDEELENDPFLINSAKLDGFEKGDVIVLPEIFGGKKAALVPIDEPVEEETEVQATQATPTPTPTVTPAETPAEQTSDCPTGEAASGGTRSPLGLAAVLLLIFFGIAWARPNRKSTPGPTAPN